jgi:hypothetical protein
MSSVYVETTIPSYLAAFPSRDLIVAGQQQITHNWWRTARERFDLFVSEAVLREIRAGDPATAARRVEIVKGLPVLDVTKEVDSLVDIYQEKFNVPRRAKTDIVHIAVAVVYELDYVVTWNCRHIANGHIVRRLMEVNHSLGRFTPLLYTPAELEVPSQEGETPC